MKYTELVRQIAGEYGDWHRPEFYINAVETKTGHRIHHGTVISSIGTHNARAAMTPSHVKHNARLLLDNCGNDPKLAKWVLNSVTREQTEVVYGGRRDR